MKKCKKKCPFKEATPNEDIIQWSLNDADISAWRYSQIEGDIMIKIKMEMKPHFFLLSRDNDLDLTILQAW